MDYTIIIDQEERNEYTHLANQALAQLNWQPVLPAILKRAQKLLAEDGIPSVIAANLIWSFPDFDEDVYENLHNAIEEVLGMEVNPMAIPPLFKLVYASSEANPVIEQMLIKLIS
jgi:hypothetical protein